MIASRKKGSRPRRFVARTLLGVGIVAVLIVVGYPTLFRPWALRYGATDVEVTKALPGDEQVPNANYQVIRAITINAPAEEVWPWIVQIGQGRGGFYSYDSLENLASCDIHSVDRIVPELQDPKVGDVIRLVPDPYVAFGQETHDGPRYVVASVEPNRALVLKTPSTDPKLVGSWSFVLEKVDDHTTRLLIRSRTHTDPQWMAPLVGVEPLHFLMEQKMLRGIKERAEGTSR